MTGLPDRVSGQQAKQDTPSIWAAPLFILVVLLVPTLILVFSNTQSATLKFAGLDWSAPLWLILLATFVAGIILGRVLAWLWRAFSRRRARIKSGSAGQGGAA